jgi:hypothetical protein
VGHEYWIASVDGKWVRDPFPPETFLESLDLGSGSSVVFTAPDTCELRELGHALGMPDAVVKIEAAGFYLLAHISSPFTRALLAELVIYTLGRCADGVHVHLE